MEDSNFSKTAPVAAFSNMFRLATAVFSAFLTIKLTGIPPSPHRKLALRGCAAAEADGHTR